MLKFNKTKYYNAINILILILCGFLVFSPISSEISLKIFKLPLALPEAIFIPFYFYFRKKLDIRVSIKSFSIGLFLIIILLIISILVNNFRFTSILSTARGYLYLVLSFSVFKNKILKDVFFIFYISLGSVLGWILQSLLFFNNLVNNTLSNNDSMAISGNMIALGLVISIPIIFRKTKLIFISTTLGIVLSLTSGIRRQVLIFIVSLLLSFLLTIKLSYKNMFKTVILIILSTSFVLIMYPILDNYISGISPAFHYRLFGKSEQLVNGDLSEGDVLRTKSIDHFYYTFWENTFPRGFVSKRTMEDVGTGIYMDSPYIELFYTFGIILCLFFVIYILYSIYFHLKSYYIRGITESGLCLVSIAIILALCFVEGSFLNYAYTTPFTGFVLSRISSRKNLFVSQF